MPSALDITLEQFHAALQRYPELITKVSKLPKTGFPTLEELDTFRYVEAPARFSKGSVEFMEREDVMKLVDWKLRHGVYRPTLPKQVASNTNEQVKETLTEAFALYQQPGIKTSAVIRKLSGPLKGIGPATASLILSVYDPAKVVFFSDEAYRWLCAGGNGAAEIKYTMKEIDDLFEKSKVLMDRLGVPALDVERVAYVLMKEGAGASSTQREAPVTEQPPVNLYDADEVAGDNVNLDQTTTMLDEIHDDLMNLVENDTEKSDLPEGGEAIVGVVEEQTEMTIIEQETLLSPPGESATESSDAIDDEVAQQVEADLSMADDVTLGTRKRKAETEHSLSPSKKRGRPPKPATEKPVPSETPRKRGRPSGSGFKKLPTSAEKRPRGRPRKEPSTTATVTEKKPRGRPPKAVSAETTPKEKKPRGRPPKSDSEPKKEIQSPKKRGRPPKVNDDTGATPLTPKERGRPSLSQKFQTEGNSVVKKGRGRPPRSDNEGKTEKDKAATEPEKKSRGRPPKAAVSEKPRGRPQGRKAVRSTPNTVIGKRARRSIGGLT